MAGVFGVAILMVSALLTAGYLLPISINGFLGSEAGTHESAPAPKCEPTWHMLLPILLVTLAALLGGIFTEPLIAALSSVLM